MSFEPGDVFLSPEHPGPNCYHPLSVASLFVLVISQILIAERRSLSVFQRSMRTSESERSTLIPVRWSQARHQICTVDENPIMEWNDEYSKRYVG